tara:strand:- start:2969 stop:4051 length:1083 start_codon:yes stop_codon:yes gene_type:complete
MNIEEFGYDLDEIIDSLIQLRTTHGLKEDLERLIPHWYETIPDKMLSIIFLLNDKYQDSIKALNKQKAEYKIFKNKREVSEELLQLILEDIETFNKYADSERKLMIQLIRYLPQNMERVLRDAPDFDQRWLQRGGSIKKYRKILKEPYFKKVRTMLNKKGFDVNNKEIEYSWKNYSNIWKDWIQTDKKIDNLYDFILKEPTWETIKYELDPYGEHGSNVPMKLIKSKKKRKVKKKSKKKSKSMKVNKLHIKNKLYKSRNKRDFKKKISDIVLYRNGHKINKDVFVNISRHGFLYLSWDSGRVFFFLDSNESYNIVLNDDKQSLSFTYRGDITDTPMEVYEDKYKIVFKSKDYNYVRNTIL